MEAVVVVFVFSSILFSLARLSPRARLPHPNGIQKRERPLVGLGRPT
jgi:hypothetical protein